MHGCGSSPVEEFDARLIIFEPLFWLLNSGIFLDIGRGFETVRHPCAPDGIAKAWCPNGITVLIKFKISAVLAFFSTSVDRSLRDGVAKIVFHGPLVARAASTRG